MKNIAVFLDRDGTVIEEIGYISDVHKIKLLPNASLAIKKLNAAGIKVIVVSNQSGVARNYFGIDAVESVMKRMVELLENEGARVDKILYCPHHPDGVIPEYAIECNCRKPKTGLMEQTAKEFDLDLSRCYMIGDKESDVRAGHNFGGKGILVLTGYGKGLWADKSLWEEEKPDFIAEDMLAAVDWIIFDLKKTGIN